MSGDFSKKDAVSKKVIYLRGALLGVASTLCAMMIFSLILLLTGIDRAYSAPFATVSIAVGSFISSKYTAKKIGDRGYLIGTIIGTAVFCIITLLSIFIGENGLSINTLFHFIIIMTASLAGGISGVNIPKHKKYI